MDESAVEKQPVFATFVGELTQISVKSLVHNVAVATQHASEIHLIIQSSGGNVSEGIYLYNLLRTAPIPVVLYNVGTICSAAVTAFLGAPQRIASRYSSFMIHRCHATFQAASPGLVTTIAESLAIDDVRTDKLLREHLNLSPQQWEQYDRHALWMSAETAVECGLASEIGEFAPPIGAPIYSFGT